MNYGKRQFSGAVRFKLIYKKAFLKCPAHVWPGGVMVRVLARDTKGLGFDFQPFHFQVTTLGKLFTHMCLCHQAV